MSLTWPRVSSVRVPPCVLVVAMVFVQDACLWLHPILTRSAPLVSGDHAPCIWPRPSLWLWFHQSASRRRHFPANPSAGATPNSVGSSRFFSALKLWRFFDSAHIWMRLRSYLTTSPVSLRLYEFAHIWSAGFFYYLECDVSRHIPLTCAHSQNGTLKLVGM